jgi:thiol:disulfide interchange protein DsbD
MRNLFLAVVCAGGLVFCACTKPAASNQGPMETTVKSAPENVVTAKPDAVELNAGGEAEAKVNITILDGYHVHSNPASNKAFIATTLTVTPPAGVTAEAPVYPPGQSMKFSFDENPLSVYAGTAVVAVKLHSADKQKAGPLSLPAKLRYQACDDSVCYPPKTIEVAIPLSIK